MSLPFGGDIPIHWPWNHPNDDPNSKRSFANGEVPADDPCQGYGDLEACMRPRPHSPRAAETEGPVGGQDGTSELPFTVMPPMIPVPSNGLDMAGSPVIPPMIPAPPNGIDDVVDNVPADDPCLEYGDYGCMRARAYSPPAAETEEQEQVSGKPTDKKKPCRNYIDYVLRPECKPHFHNRPPLSSRAAAATEGEEKVDDRSPAVAPRSPAGHGNTGTWPTPARTS
ncbi:hypothetical protein PG994_008235 [Apiospora phragmitis]|uniref:Uncharacterized protein n=1 Tax=Apiospora phragmitis TaxID=2905665 RepID=A0ABR1USG5_9PEZI